MDVLLFVWQFGLLEQVPQLESQLVDAEVPCFGKCLLHPFSVDEAARAAAAQHKQEAESLRAEA